MKKETLKRLFQFLEEKENNNPPVKWKLLNNIPFPEGLEVGGGLTLSNSSITSLPEGLKIGGYLNLHNCQDLTSLPEGLQVVGDLFLHSCKNIESLPEGLKVGGHLDLRNTTIGSLPEGLEVGGSLFIKNTALLEYTDEKLREMIKPGFIEGKIFRQ